MSADAVFSGGPIFGGVQLLPEDTAVAVTGGRISFVGPSARQPDAVTTIDLAGRLLLPGFIDAHNHALSAGVDRNACDLTDATSAADALAAVAAYAASTDREWIVGSGWSMASFVGGCPTAEQLDTVTGERPAFIHNRDHHGAWVNSAALRRAGVTAATPDPSDGRIERDAAGNPTGTLHEGAMDLVGLLVPAIGAEELRAGLDTAQRVLHSYGVTGWQEAIVGSEYGGMPDVTGTYESAGSDLTATVVGAQWLPRPTTIDDVAGVVARFVAERTRTAGSRFSKHAVKIMVDGVPENRTALMIEPYCGCGADIGLAYHPNDVLRAAVTACDAAGLDVHFHAIGDGAVRAALDAVEAARQANGISTARHHIAHLQVVDPADIPRFFTLGVTANLQALWACRDQQMSELVEPAIGPERSSWQYPFADLHASGTRLVMGSDWPVSTPDPWAAISVACSRIGPGETDPPYLPHQALDLTTCLAAYTSGSAWINRHEQAGSIRVGADADLVVTDRNPYELPVTDLWQVTTAATYVRGTRVFDATARHHRSLLDTV